MLTITNCIIAFTSIISLIAFSNAETKMKMIFYPYGMNRDKQFYRFLTHAFIHGDFVHLFFNMFTLYSFGNFLETYYLPAYFGTKAAFIYICLYVLSIYASSLYDYIKHKDNSSYMALGASGATSAVLFASILFAPWPQQGGIYLFMLPIPIKPVIFGILYLVYCMYASKRSNDNIAHDAHFYGAIFGFIFPILFKWELIIEFFEKIKLAIGS
jgi:membrane associated rhomboid family serine protease